MTLPPVFHQPLRPLFLPNALLSHNRPHPPRVCLVPPPPATPTPLAKSKGKQELLQLHPHHHLTQSGPPPLLTRISRHTTCQLSLPHYMATLKHLPRNTPTRGKQKNSPKGNTLQAPAWTPGHQDRDWCSPNTMASKAAPTDAQAVTPPPEGKKGRQAKASASDSSVAVASGEAFTKSPPPSPPSCLQIFRLQNDLRTPPRGPQDSSPLPRHRFFWSQRSQLLPSTFLHLHGQRQRLSVTARYRSSHPRLRLPPLFRSAYLVVEQGLSGRQLPLGSLQTSCERNATFDSLYPSCVPPLRRCPTLPHS